MKVEGWAHICFFPPFDDKDNYESFQGHLIDSQTKEIYGLKGQWMDYDDPERNDCMDPHAFYRMVITNYGNSDSSIRSLVIRREMHDDYAALTTDPLDSARFDQSDLSFHYKPASMKTDEKAYEHCEKYLPNIVSGYNKQGDEMDNSAADWLVTLGSATFDDLSV